MVARCLTRILTDDSELSATLWLGGPTSSSQEIAEQNTHAHTHTHTRVQSRMHVQKHPNAQIHTHLHTIMLSQHTVAGYICARANSKQLWSSYQNRSPKTPSVQLLCTKSFISLHTSHTINHKPYSLIVMYIFLWSCLAI